MSTVVEVFLVNGLIILCATVIITKHVYRLKYPKQRRVRVRDVESSGARELAAARNGLELARVELQRTIVQLGIDQVLDARAEKKPLSELEAGLEGLFNEPKPNHPTLNLQ